MYLFVSLSVCNGVSAGVCVCVCFGGGGFISSCRWPRSLIYRSGEKKSPPRVETSKQ